MIITKTVSYRISFEGKMCSPDCDGSDSIFEEWANNYRPYCKMYEERQDYKCGWAGDDYIPFRCKKCLEEFPL
jgi:hypothetical protein